MPLHINIHKIEDLHLYLKLFLFKHDLEIPNSHGHKLPFMKSNLIITLYLKIFEGF